MLFYLLGPFSVPGMSWHESYIALGFSLVWIIAGYCYFAISSKARGKEIVLTSKPGLAASPP
jgi:hypothetical protein